MPWILGGAGVVVVAVVVVLIIVLTGGSDTSSPQGVAEAAVDAVNDKNTEELAKLTCGAGKEDVEQYTDPGSIDPSLAQIEVKAELVEVKESGDTATATVKVTYSNVPDELKDVIKDDQREVGMKKDGDNWCIDFASAGGSGSGS